MEEENKNEENLEEQKELEPIEENIELVEEATEKIFEVQEQVEEKEIQELEPKEPDVGFEPVVAPKKPKESKKADLDLVTVAPVQFVSFEDDKEHLNDDPKANLDIMQDVKMHITVELGRAKSSVKKILDLSKGSIVELNKVAGEQVELYANGRFIAYGEVIVIEDKFGLRVTNVSHQNIHSLQ